jgi:biopolymer transport protein ExbD
MRQARARFRRRGVSVEITPMVDVVFLLIIFFMTTAQFSRLTRAEVDLPQERGEQQRRAEEAGLVVNVTRSGELIVSNRTVALGELQQLVQDELRSDSDEQPRLLIRADRQADVRHLNEVVELMTSLGFGEARLATEVPPRLGGGS